MKGTGRSCTPVSGLVLLQQSSEVWFGEVATEWQMWVGD